MQKPGPGPDATHIDSITASTVAGLHSGQMAALANLPIAAVSAWVVSDAVTTELLVGWLALFATVIAGRFAVTHWQRRHDAPVQSQITAHTCGATLSGVMWGTLPILLMPQGTFADFAFCGFVIAGNTAGALPSLSWHRPAYLGYLLGATLPLTASLFALAEAPFPAMGSLTLLYAAVLVLTARRYNRTLQETLLLRDDVTQLGERLVSTEDELTTVDLEKWRTISHLSHELRTPLNAVLGFSELIERETFGPVGRPEYRGYAQNIRESGEAILHLVEELLEMSDANTGAVNLVRASTDCRRLVNECIAERSQQAENSAIAIIVDLSAARHTAFADAAKLRMAVDSVLDNAIRYTPAGGRVSIGIAVGAAENIAITISDTGAGMTAQEIEIALSPFGRLASPLIQQMPGTGLGLPLARLITEMHGGHLDISSTPGSGTTVSIVIPQRDTSPPSQQARSA